MRLRCSRNSRLWGLYCEGRSDRSEHQPEVGEPRRQLEALYVPYFDQLLSGPSPLVLDTEMPSVNGLLSAHALAKLYGAIAKTARSGGSAS